MQRLGQSFNSAGILLFARVALVGGSGLKHGHSMRRCSPMPAGVLSAE